MYQIFADLLKEKGLTAYRVSQDTGISQATLSDWKRGKSVPKMQKMQLIADYLGVSLEYIMTGKKESSSAPQITDGDLKRFLFGDENVSDDILNEVRSFAQFALNREKEKESL